MRRISSSPARRRTAALAAALALAAAPAAVGCGGDEQAAAPGPRPSAAPPADESRKPGEPAPTGPANEQDPGKGGAGAAPGGPPVGEDPATAEHDDREPAGAGDEEAARTEAVLTGRGGSIGPREVRVAAYIAVLVRLRSGDGGRYALTVDGRTLTAGPGAGSDDETMLEGLPPEGRYVARPAGGGAAITIVATGEPGP